MVSSLVTVKQGQLKGVQKKSVLSGKEYYSFLGIPYAQPPLYALRFQPPKPAGNWSGVRDASKEKDVCLQMDLLVTQQIIGSEDCLYLNVHVPQEPSEITSPKPVIIFIHGGAFTFGSGSIEVHSPDYIIDNDVIFVSFNYRLHVFGFLGLGLPDCPGNVGLKDQLLAIEWVKDNIESFGGDPNNITMMGQSCGATSIHLLTISPLTKDKGLFQRSIFSSGHALSIWSLTDEPLKTANDFGNILGYGGKDKRKLLKFLKSMPAIKLAEAMVKLRTEHIKDVPESMLQFSFRPCVEEIKNGAVLPEHPLELLKRDQTTVPIISGFNNQESILAFDADAIWKHLNLFENGPEPIALCNLLLNDKSEAMEILNEMKEFYSLDLTGSADDKLLGILRLYGDWLTIKYYNRSFAQTLEDGNPLYQYIFAYEGQRNIHKMTVNLPIPIKGASHGDDIGYLFPVHWLSKQEYTEDDLNTIKLMSKLWTNFAKTGNPNSDDINVNWSPVTKGERKTYLNIDKTAEIKQVDGELEERFKFWDRIMHRYLYH